MIEILIIQTLTVYSKRGACASGIPLFEEAQLEVARISPSESELHYD